MNEDFVDGLFIGVIVGFIIAYLFLEYATRGSSRRSKYFTKYK